VGGGNRFKKGVVGEELEERRGDDTLYGSGGKRRKWEERR
jgi:hypothetical protein